MQTNNCRTRTQYIILLVSLLLPCCLIHPGCGSFADKDDVVAPIHKYIPPLYDLVQVKVLPDTLHFPLDDTTFNSIKSFNLFSSNGEEFIAFFDERSLSINVYQFQSKKKIKVISLKKSLKGQKMYKTTAYMASFDSILVINNKGLYLVDNKNTIKLKIKFLDDPPLAWAIFENNVPPVLKGHYLYASVRPYMNDESLKALKKWKVLYEFDLQNKKATIRYPLPQFLQSNYYGTRFLDHSYCFNDSGHFVFSFPADSSIYETNLKDYHIAFSVKSISQQSPIKPMTKKEIEDDPRKGFMTRDSYSSIYFDSFKKRYLRIAHSRVKESGFDESNEKGQKIIILNKDFKIIGESPIDNSISLKSLFITHDGQIYARVMRKDEYALHFIRLSYIENNNVQNKIAKNENVQNK